MAINLTLRRNLSRLLTSDEVDTNFTTLADALQGIWDSTGQPGGIAPLDASGRLPMGYAPYSLRLPATSHDLNAYVTPGTWFQASNSGAAAGANYPVNVAGWLEVVPDYQPASSAVMQRYTTRATASTATRVFVRTQTGTAGTWLDWTEIPNFAGVFGFMGVMPGAQNLNDYTQRGIWIVGSSNTASGGTNYPIGHSGVLLVLSGIHPGQAAGTTGIVQVYVAANSNRLFFRTLVVGTWSAWDEAVRTSLMGAASGVATLDANKKIPQDQIPGVLGKSLGVADNLNDFDTPGTYYMNSNATALPELNYPVVLAGMLMVETATGGNLQVTQLYVTNPASNPRMFLRIRFGTSKTWGPWFELARFDQAMTHTYLTGSGVDANTLTADNTFYSWATSAVMSGGSNWPPAPAAAVGFMSVVTILQTAVVQTVTLRPQTNRRTITYQRCSSANVWGGWYVVGAISLASDLPTADCGDVYVDGFGWHTWSSTGYILASSAETLPTTAHDLNSYKKPGKVYRQSSTAGAQAGSNYPVQIGGLLEVVGTDFPAQTKQVYTVASTAAVGAAQGPRQWWRFAINDTWSPWQQVATTDVTMTHTFLTAATDANTLTADNTWYSWVSATVWNENFPPHPIKVGGFIQTYWLSAANIVQIATLNAGGGSRNIVYQRQANGSTLTWTQWRLMSPLSTVAHLPVVNVGDAYVDGVGIHRWYETAGYYVRVPDSPMQREGLGTEWASAASILVKPGRCASQDGRILLELTANNTRTIQTSGAFVHGASGNGLLSGARQAGWWYYVFLLRRDSDGSVCVAFDNNAQCANRPATHSHYRRIGTVRTNGSNNLVAFTQIGNEFWYDELVPIYNGDSVISGTTYQPALGLPGISTIAHLQGWMTSGGAGQNPVINMARQVRGGGYSAYSLVMVANPSANHINNWSIPAVFVPNTTPNVRITSSAYGTIVLHLQGYTDLFED